MLNLKSFQDRGHLLVSIDVTKHQSLDLVFDANIPYNEEIWSDPQRLLNWLTNLKCFVG
jgi:hypothetical protein